MAQCGPTEYKPVAQWILASGGYVPPNAVEVGYDDGNIVFVARAHHSGDTLPGKLVPAHGACYVPWGGEEHPHHQYEVLVNSFNADLEWQYTDGVIPSGAIQGGSTSSGEPLYIGRVNHEGAMVAGKVQQSHGCLYIPYGGGEHAHQSFEILVIKNITF